MEDFLIYLQLGWEHIMSWDALDHQMFLVSLLLGRHWTGWLKLLKLISFFTLGHGISILLTTLGIQPISIALAEVLIPITIVLNAVIWLWKGHDGQAGGWIFCFGLIHGLGFAATAQKIDTGTGQVALLLTGFNIGVELGQILLGSLIFGIMGFLRRWPTTHYGIALGVMFWALWIAIERFLEI